MGAAEELPLRGSVPALYGPTGMGGTCLAFPKSGDKVGEEGRLPPFQRPTIEKVLLPTVLLYRLVSLAFSTVLLQLALL